PSLSRPHPPPLPILPLSLHDALPIFVFQRPVDRDDAVARRGPASHRGKLRVLSRMTAGGVQQDPAQLVVRQLLAALPRGVGEMRDRKSTRLNSSHEWISYAVFCLKKK